MTSAMMNFIKNCEHPIVVDKLPECCVSILHTLVRASGTDRTYQSIQALP
ncbi:hypothetical protein ALP32_200164 [Pseudomonas avellanae]|uniref:Uncharacterized protein n=1 Tax=Pseudomonas avellanae TaxID=46257 RepID=A0A3M5STE2_9PSED|nr:hypothetical protein ALP32_200164 [Pseudomonas avellanae]